MNIDFPFDVGSNGRTADADEDAHVRDLIEQLLFTAPGERVNRPDFGSGAMQLVFAPGSAELAATTQFLIQGALQQWLGDRIEVAAVEVQSEEARLRISVQYRVRRTQRSRTVELERRV